MRFAFHQAAEHTAAVACSIAEDNARAVPVLISGAAGPYEKSMNGLFTPSSERSLDGRVIYKMCHSAHMIIEHHDGQWAIKPLPDKGVGAMQGGVVGGCAFESCNGRVWFVGNSGKWEEQPEVAISFGVDVEVQVKLWHARYNVTPPSFQPRYACCFMQAAHCAEQAARAVARFNARAVPMLLSGATGICSENINGFYVPAQESNVDGCVVYSKCGDPSTCIERSHQTWNLRSIDHKGTKIYNRTAWFDAVDPSGFLQMGPLLLGGTLLVSTKFEINPFTVTVLIGAEVNRQVSDRCKRDLTFTLL
jgi:hypothetical protein